MKKRLVALLTVLAILLTFAACNSGTTPAGTTTPDSSAPADSGTPAENTPDDSSTTGEKVIRIGMEGEPNTWFGSPGGSGGSEIYGFGCYANLWTRTSDGEFHYLLGESYEYSEDGTSITIKIRDNAGFSNGDKVTADDVLFSMETDFGQMAMRTGTIDWDRCEVVDDTTLVLGLLQQTPTFIDDIGLLFIGSRAWTENNTNEDKMYVDILESGPYYLPDGWMTGQKMIMVKNPYYFDQDSIVYDRIEVSFIPEETTRYLEFTTGGLDVAALFDSNYIDEISAGDTFTLDQVLTQCNVGLMLDTEGSDIFENHDLRMALMYAVDSRAIVESICGSAYHPATSMLPSKSWAYKSTEYGYDPEKAKQYYEASGLKDFTFEILVQNVEPTASIAEALQAYYAELGITMTINAVDMPTFFSIMGSGGMTCTITQYMGSYDPGSVLNPWLGTGRGTTNKTPPEIQAKLDEACTSMADQATRTQLFYEVQDEVAAYGKFLPIYEKTVNIVSTDGFDPSGSIHADGFLIPLFIK